METSNISTIFALIMLAAGVYFVYLFIMGRSKKKFPDTCLIFPKGAKFQDCADPEGYVDYIAPRLLIFGIVLLVIGGFDLADASFGLLESWTASLSTLMQILIAEFISVVLPLAALIWFAVCLNKAQKNLW